MLSVGIEAAGFYGGCVSMDVMSLTQHRQVDTSRFENLLMKQKSVALSYEDPVSYAVNAAKPMIDALTEQQRDRIELLITCTESGIDFGKSLSTYVHHYLGLRRNCRLFEIKQACYSGTAGLQAACQFVLSQVSPGAKALVIATDLARFVVESEGDGLTMDWSFFEPSGGAGAVALLVGEQPVILRMDVGANGYYGYEVMDTCRPIPDSEAGNADLSLLSYLDCCDQTFQLYRDRVPAADYGRTFDYLSFHTPFGGMVKGAHRNMMRRHVKADKVHIEHDFEQRVQPGLTHCQRVGNIMGGTVLLSILSSIDHADTNQARRLGCFSYGSGCSSEFYSGVFDRHSQKAVAAMGIRQQLDLRHPLTFSEYESVLESGASVRFGTRNAQWTPDADTMLWPSISSQIAKLGRPRLFLTGIQEFHRQYAWFQA